MLTSAIRIGHTHTDTDRDRRIKSIFVIAMIGIILFLLQLVLFEDRTTFELILDWAGIVGVAGSVIVLQFGKRIDWAYMFAASVGLLVIAGLLALLGNRNGDLFFLPTIPIFAVALLGAKRSLPWFAATLLIALSALAVDALALELASPLHRSDINPQGLLFHGPAKETITAKLFLPFLTGLTLSYLVVYSAYSALQQASDRVEGLLLNILPTSIAARLTEETQQKLRDEGAGIADEYDSVTILFADIVGFTDLAAKTKTADLMMILDQVFTEFDHLAEKYRVEKIKTIGDAYMAVCGLPEPNPEHARVVADMALDMLEAVRRYRANSGVDIRLRVGINSGPVIAGIIGRKKFIYDLWGDAVNVASRMESEGEPDTIQVSSRIHEALKDRYDLEPLGEITVKGKGDMPAWRLIGRKAA